MPGRGSGINQKINARSRQRTMTICLLDAAFLTLAGRKANGDHRGGAGECQKREAEEVEVEELREEEAEDDSEGNENLEIACLEGDARSLGDLSKKGSLGVE